MHEAGCPVVPQNLSKQPIVKWGKYQHELPTPDELYRWAKRRDVHYWAFLTGQASGICVLDFDLKHGGMETFKRLGLQATLVTPGGGRHVYVKAPPWRVKTIGQPGPDGYPGMELKADGAVCTFCSTLLAGSQKYRTVAGRRKYDVAGLPAGLAALFQPYRKGDNRKTADVAALSDRPLPSVLQLALDRLEAVGETEEGRQWKALCPVHDEREASFGIGLGNDRQIVMHCFGCNATVDDFAAALEIDSSEFSRRPWDSNWKEEPAYQIGADIPLSTVTWLWFGVVPIGKLTIFEGDPGKGKSVATADIAARITTHRPMPGDQPNGLDGPYAALIISGEDDYSDTIKPRLLAAGVDESRIVRLTLERDSDGNALPLTLPNGLLRIREAIAGAKRDRGLVVKLIIIDPITNYLGERTNSNVDPSVRAVLFPLSELAQELDVAIILVRHLNKAGEMKAMYRGGGSIAFIGMSRSAYVFEAHPNDPEQIVMAPVKTNLLARNDKWAYTYHLESSAKYDAPEVRWGDRIRMDADTLLKGHDARRDAPERERAEDLLNSLLDDPDYQKGIPQKVVEAEMDKAGISMSTAKSAKKELKLVAKRLTFESGEKKGKTEKWVWRRPIEEESNVVHFEPRARDS